LDESSNETQQASYELANDQHQHQHHHQQQQPVDLAALNVTALHPAYMNNDQLQAAQHPPAYIYYPPNYFNAPIYGPGVATGGPTSAQTFFSGAQQQPMAIAPPQPIQYAAPFPIAQNIYYHDQQQQQQQQQTAFNVAYPPHIQTVTTMPPMSYPAPIYAPIADPNQTYYAHPPHLTAGAYLPPMGPRFMPYAVPIPPQSATVYQNMPFGMPLLPPPHSTTGTSQVAQLGAPPLHSQPIVYHNPVNPSAQLTFNENGKFN
jgi:hypothetical protein